MSAKKKSQNLIARLKYGSGKNSSTQLTRIINEAKEVFGRKFFSAEQFYVPSYGGPYVLNLIGKERKQEIFASEQNSMYNNYTMEMLEDTNIKMNLFVDDYENGEIEGLDGSLPTNVLSNTAYEIKIGNWKKIVYPTIIKRTNVKLNLDKQVWVLPTKWWFSDKEELVEFRKLLKTIGFKKIIILPTDTFKDEGIPYLECCAIFCEKDYSGPITVETRKGNTYQYDYSDKDVYYFGDDSAETDILYKCLELNDPYHWETPKNPDLYKSQARKRNEYYSKKTNGTTIKVVDLIQKNGLQIEEINESEVSDKKNINTYRLALTTLPGGTNYGQGLGYVQIFEPGMVGTTKHRVAVLEGVKSMKEAKKHLDYLLKIGENIKNKTSDSPTINRPQMKAVLKRNTYEREFGKIK